MKSRTLCRAEVVACRRVFRRHEIHRELVIDTRHIVHRRVELEWNQNNVYSRRFEAGRAEPVRTILVLIKPDGKF